MNAIISKGDKTAHVQLPVERKQLAGALSYLGANHTSDYDLKYNEENKDGLKVSLECFGVVENAIAKALPVGFRFHTLNESLTLMGNLPYQNRREVENTIKVDGLDSYEQLNRMLTEAYPQSVTTKYYCPLTIQVHSRDCYGDIDEDEKYQKPAAKDDEEIPPNSYAVEQTEHEQNYPESEKTARRPQDVKIHRADTTETNA